MLLPVLFLLAASASADSGGDYFKTPVFTNPGRPGAWVTQTRGEVWPRPVARKDAFGRYSIVDAARFEFQVSLDPE